MNMYLSPYSWGEEKRGCYCLALAILNLISSADWDVFFSLLFQLQYCFFLIMGKEMEWNVLNAKTHLTWKIKLWLGSLNLKLPDVVNLFFFKPSLLHWSCNIPDKWDNLWNELKQVKLTHNKWTCSDEFVFFDIWKDWCTQIKTAHLISLCGKTH